MSVLCFDLFVNVFVIRTENERHKAIFLTNIYDMFGVWAQVFLFLVGVYVDFYVGKLFYCVYLISYISKHLSKFN